MDLQKLSNTLQQCVQLCNATLELLRSSVNELLRSQDEAEILQLISELRYGLNGKKILTGVERPTESLFIRVDASSRNSHLNDFKKDTVSFILESIAFIRNEMDAMEKVIKILEDGDVHTNASKSLQIFLNMIYVIISKYARAWGNKSKDAESLHRMKFIIEHDLACQIKQCLHPFVDDITVQFSADVFKFKYDYSIIKMWLNYNDYLSLLWLAENKLRNVYAQSSVIIDNLHKYIKTMTEKTMVSEDKMLRTEYEVMLQMASKAIAAHKDCSTYAFKQNPFPEFKGEIDGKNMPRLLDFLYDHNAKLVQQEQIIKEQNIYLTQVCNMIKRFNQTLQDHIKNQQQQQLLEKKQEIEKERLAIEQAREQRLQEQQRLENERNAAYAQTKAFLKEQKIKRELANNEKEQIHAKQAAAIHKRAQKQNAANQDLVQQVNLCIDVPKKLSAEQKDIFTNILKEPCAGKYTFEDLAKFIESLGAKVDRSTGSSHIDIDYNDIKAKIWRPHGRNDNKVPQICINIIVDALFRLQIIRGNKVAARGNKKNLSLFESTVSANEVEVTPFIEKTLSLRVGMV